jgi:hypothetical protein
VTTHVIKNHYRTAYYWLNYQSCQWSVFLFQDIGTTKRRTMHSLGIRISLAAALMATTVYGFLSGQLGVGAPWDERKYRPAQAVVAPEVSNDVDKEE